jgi:hypothetical protein
MNKSGEICKEGGFYRCNVHHEYLIRLYPGSKFPDCAHGSYGNHSTLWNPARNVKAIMAELKTEVIQC